MPKVRDLNCTGSVICQVHAKTIPFRVCTPTYVTQVEGNTEGSCPHEQMADTYNL